MGNGYPAAAFAGRDEVDGDAARQGQPRRHVRRELGRGGGGASRRWRSSATPTPSPRSTPPVRCIQDGVRGLLDAKGLAYDITGHPAMFGIMFREEVASEYRDWATTDHDLYDAIAVGMQARGAMPEPDSREPWFMCEAHAQGDTVDRVITSFGDSLDAALEARAHGTLAVEADGAMSHHAAG